MDAINYRDDAGRLVVGVALDSEQEDQIGLDSERELAFAVEAYDPQDPASIRWLAACAAIRAGDLEEREGPIPGESPDPNWMNP